MYALIVNINGNGGNTMIRDYTSIEFKNENGTYLIKLDGAVELTAEDMFIGLFVPTLLAAGYQQGSIDDYLNSWCSCNGHREVDFDAFNDDYLWEDVDARAEERADKWMRDMDKGCTQGKINPVD